MRNVFQVMVVLFVGLVLFGMYYNYKYSMEIIKNFEINSPKKDLPKLLLATQGSQYKNLVTEGIIEELEPLDIYIQVLDVTNLPKTKATDWDAILIIHTWQINYPPPQVQEFIIANLKAKDKIVTLSTSSDGVHHIEGVDAITSASVLEEAPQNVDVLVGKIKEILKN